MNMGRTIKELRRVRGMNQQQLADSVPLSMTYLSLIEGNKREPSLATLRSICDVLGVPLPIVFFLALDVDDVKKEKRPAFEQLSPALRAFLKTVFVE
ncbi:MAG TPA: helix-turn-helix transcriptional regulator [Candidatus Kapabacteria bacterium]|nr:helix-turn-helix transcriptional regulator [Candidatus Kapabacteria bacterium]